MMEVDNKPESLVSILVACAGHLDYTRLCVASILRFTRQPYELFFLDSDSLDGSKEFLDGLSLALPFRVETVVIPIEVEPSKRKREEALSIRGENAVLINNDVIVTENWLNLLLAASAESSAGLVAPMSNFTCRSMLVDPIPYALSSSDLDVKSRAELFTTLEKVNRFAKEWRAKQRELFVPQEEIGGGCALLKRDALARMGNHPMRSSLGIFDMAALGKRVKDVGCQLVACKQLYVHYFGTKNPT